MANKRKSRLPDTIKARRLSFSDNEGRSEEVKFLIKNLEKMDKLWGEHLNALKNTPTALEEEARALLGRFEYQKGNIEAALHVFEGVDVAVIMPKMIATLGAKGESHKRRSRSFATQPMSIHAVSLLL